MKNNSQIKKFSPQTNRNAPQINKSPQIKISQNKKNPQIKKKSNLKKLLKKTSTKTPQIKNLPPQGRKSH